MKPTEMRKYK